MRKQSSHKESSPSFIVKNNSFFDELTPASLIQDQSNNQFQGFAACKLEQNERIRQNFTDS